MFDEDDLLPLSGLQHLLFCERQWALIHIEQQWEENRLTEEGRVLHNRVHESATETRPGIITARGAAVALASAGIGWRSGVVEFHRAQDGESGAVELGGTQAGCGGRFRSNTSADVQSATPGTRSSYALRRCAWKRRMR